ncbi:CLUMA_CG012934, isoform A [Clunio marinus]|uniref:CLUMA_CG012934, isoform A n=1 Tax=Clunio marinus TaxID=568069 RepID=A0A1J1IKL2_9DIPT|nr:CLUMA_CG012934, isoform A [Clunio marinus]
MGSYKDDLSDKATYKMPQMDWFPSNCEKENVKRRNEIKTPLMEEVFKEVISDNDTSNIDKQTQRLLTLDAFSHFVKKNRL